MHLCPPNMHPASQPTTAPWIAHLHILLIHNINPHAGVGGQAVFDLGRLQRQRSTHSVAQRVGGVERSAAGREGGDDQKAMAEYSPTRRVNMQGRASVEPSSRRWEPQQAKPSNQHMLRRCVRRPTFPHTQTQPGASYSTPALPGPAQPCPALSLHWTAPECVSPQAPMASSPCLSVRRCSPTGALWCGPARPAAPGRGSRRGCPPAASRRLQCAQRAQHVVGGCGRMWVRWAGGMLQRAVWVRMKVWVGAAPQKATCTVHPTLTAPTLVLPGPGGQLDEAAATGAHNLDLGLRLRLQRRRGGERLTTGVCAWSEGPQACVLSAASSWLVQACTAGQTRVGGGVGTLA